MSLLSHDPNQEIISFCAVRACVHACGGMLDGSEAQMSAPALSFCLLAPGAFLFSLVSNVNPSKSNSDQVNLGESKSS